MTDDIATGPAYPERNQIDEYEGDYGSPGDANEGQLDVLERILHNLQNPPVRPRTSLLFRCEATALVSQVINSHVRVHVTKLIIPGTPTTPFTINIGTSAFSRGWAIAGEFDVDFIIDAGADVQLSASANIYAAIATDIWMVGDIIN